MPYPAAPQLHRGANKFQPKVEIIIACEGEVTEKDYLENCKIAYGAGMVRMRWLPINGVPMAVVEAAIQERERLKRQAKKSKDSYDVFRVWAVFDRDEHPEVPEAIELAKKNSIDVGFSDPCFEIWPLLHFINYGKMEGRHKVQALLHGQMPSYHHEKNPKINFEEIKNNFDDAYSRSIALKKARIAEGDEFCCPSTTMGELVKKIIENGRGSFRKKT